jgi:hypothetical protein
MESLRSTSSSASDTGFCIEVFQRSRSSLWMEEEAVLWELMRLGPSVLGLRVVAAGADGVEVVSGHEDGT